MPASSSAYQRRRSFQGQVRSARIGSPSVILPPSQITDVSNAFIRSTAVQRGAWARLDTLVGAVFTILVAACMMLAGNAAFQRHWEFTDPAQIAVQLGGVFGPFLKNAILLLMSSWYSNSCQFLVRL